MILLDSFLKESARFSPSDSSMCPFTKTARLQDLSDVPLPQVSLRRKALAPFSFSDGAHVNPGDVACIPMRAIMQDEARYPDARTFDGYRFVDDSRTGSRAKFTDVEMSYPIWGYGKRAWSVYVPLAFTRDLADWYSNQ